MKIKNLNAERTEGFFTIHYVATANVYNDGGINSGPIRLMLTVSSESNETIYQTTFSPSPDLIGPRQQADFSVPFVV